MGTVIETEVSVCVKAQAYQCRGTWLISRDPNLNPMYNSAYDVNSEGQQARGKQKTANCAS